MLLTTNSTKKFTLI